METQKYYNYSQITSYLFLGTFPTQPILIDLIENNNVGSFLSIIEDKPNLNKYKKKINHKWISLRDNVDEKIDKYFDECVDSIHNHIKGGKKVYVHCYHGMSRSASIVIPYLMKYGIMLDQDKFDNSIINSFSKSSDYVKGKRPIINPNDGFKDQLNDYKMILL